MRYAISALLLTGSFAVTVAAWADTTYTVDKVIITGSKTVPTDKLLAAVQEHAGSRVTQADIVADQEAILKVLGAANVVGGIQTSMRSKPNNHIDVIFAVNDQGAQAPVVTKVAPKLHAETFVGNVSIPSDKLAAASGLTIGEDLDNSKITAAQQAIAAAYKAAKLPVGMNLSGAIQTVSPGQVDVVWTIQETKAKKKKSTEDEGFKADE
jgi:outer membrane protein assembly factor BamA